jgi:hypothetical protein
MALGLLAVALAPGVAQANPVPGFDLDPVELSARIVAVNEVTGDIATVCTDPQLDDWTGCATAL